MLGEMERFCEYRNWLQVWTIPGNSPLLFFLSIAPLNDEGVGSNKWIECEALGTPITYTLFM